MTVKYNRENHKFEVLNTENKVVFSTRDREAALGWAAFKNMELEVKNETI